MRTFGRNLLASASFALLLACHGAHATGPTGQVEANGVVRYVALEGGFYSVESVSGKYDPLNLPTSYQQDGLRVYFAGIVRKDMGSIHMYGQVLELTDIQRR